MAERDPFGRLPNENPLEFLGKRSNGTEAAAAEAMSAEQAAPAAAPAPAGDPAPRRTPSQYTLDPAQIAVAARRTIKAAVVLAILVAVGGGLAALMLVGGSATDGVPAVRVQESGDAAPESPSARATPPPPTAHAAAAPRGLSASSLLTRRNFAPALRRLRTSGLGRLRTLSIRPERVDATLLTRGGRLRSVQVRSDGSLSDFGASGPGFGALDTIAFARIESAAPARLVRSAAGRLHVAASKVDYVVLLQLGPALSWSVFMRDGKHFIADARGRITRRIS